MLANAIQPLPTFVAQHAEEAAFLRNLRSVLIRAPHVRMADLCRLDERIAAHLDGLAVAGELGMQLCEAALENPGVGEVFTATVRSIEDKDQRRLDRLIALAEALPECERGVISAFGWVSAQFLQGTIKEFLSASDPFHRSLGIAACVMHRVDSGPRLDAAIRDIDPLLRAQALRAAGECGRRDLLPVCLDALEDEQLDCRFQAARSAALLGGGRPAATALESLALQPGPNSLKALRLVMFAADGDRARTLVRQFAGTDDSRRTAILATGWAGDPGAVGWLVKQMADNRLARVAGEAFTMITDAGLANLGLERSAPENFEAGPTGDPDDENVEMDPDDNLPWPDVEKVQAWWQANRARFQSGVRHFMGEPPSAPHCRKVLREGFQRQRVAAAEHLCLLQPGSPLFNVAAPAWRQQRLLSKMS